MSIIKNFGFVYVRLLIVMLLSLVTSSYILQRLGADDYGLYSVVGGVVIILAFLNNAMAVTTQRYLSLYIGDTEKLIDTFKISKGIHLRIALIVLLLSETFGLYFLNHYLNFNANRLFAVNVVYQFSVFSIVLMILNVPYLSLLLVGQKVNFYALVGILEAILKFTLAYFLIFVDSDRLIAYAALLFLISLFTYSLYYFYATKTFKYIKKVGSSFDIKTAREMISFAVWNLLGVLAGLGQNVGVNVLLNIYFKPEVSASRALSLQIYNAFNTITSNAQVVYNPIIIRKYAESPEDTHGYVFIFSTLSFFMLAFVIVPVYFYLDPLLIFWLKKVPVFLEIFIKIMFFELLIASIIGPLHSLIQATGNIRNYQIVVSGLLLLNIPIGCLLYENGYSPEAIYYVSVILVFLSFVVRLIFLRMMGLINILEYLKKVIAPILIMSSIIISINFFVDVSVITKLIVSEIIIIVFSVLMFLFNKDIRNILVSMKRAK